MSDSYRHRLNRSRIWLIRLFAVLVVVFTPMTVSSRAYAQGPNRVGLVVVYRSGQVTTHCVEFNEPSISGYEVLMRAGLDVGIDASNSMGVAICRIGSDGCNYPQQLCFCQCTDLSGAVPCEYWSYWHLQGSTWQYSGMGASNHQVTHGNVEGWVWGSGMLSGASPPPNVTFDRLCPTSGQPAEAPQLSPPPKPANDDNDERLELPVITRFVADRTLIQAGDSVVLDWELHDAKKAYLIYDDVRQGIEGEGPNSRAVLSPTRTTTYTLLARNDDGDVSQQVVVVVNPVTPTPTGTPAPSPTPTSVPTATSTSTSTPVRTPTLTPTATQLPSATLPVVSSPSILAPATQSSDVSAVFTPTWAPGLPTAQGDVSLGLAGQGVSTPQLAKMSETAIARHTVAPARRAEVSGDVATAGRPSAGEASPRRQSGLLVVWLGLGVALALGGLVTIGIVMTLLLIVRSGKAGRR